MKSKYFDTTTDSKTFKTLGKAKELALWPDGSRNMVTHDLAETEDLERVYGARARWVHRERGTQGNLGSPTAESRTKPSAWLGTKVSLNDLEQSL